MKGEHSTKVCVFANNLISKEKHIEYFRSSLRESVTQHLYGVSKKDHVNYTYISSIDGASNEANKASESLDVNHLSTEQRRVILPSFQEMINHVHEMSNKRLSNSSTQHYVYGRAKIAYSYEIYTEVKNI